MSWRYKGGFIQAFFDPLTSGAQWKQYSGVWTRQSQMQAAGAQNWPGVFLGVGLLAWGSNNNGQLGQNNTINRSSPVQVGSIERWNYVGVGNGYTVAVKLNGTSNQLWSWGRNDVGQLGQNLTYSTSVSSPVQITSVSGWSKLSVGYANAAWITNGALYAWGANNSGKLGVNSTQNRSTLTQVGSLTTWANVSVNWDISLAIRSDGTLWGWGSGSNNVISPSSTVNRSSPVQIGTSTNWSEVSVGLSSALAIRTTGTLWAWGSSFYGQVGQNNTVSQSSPVQIGSATNWAAIKSMSEDCLAIKTDGTLWSWGRNDWGQLGQGDTQSRSSPTQVGALTNWSKISGMSQSVLAIKTDGTLWAWGYNASGELGQNNTTNTTSPVQIGTLNSWSTVSAGASLSAATYTYYVAG